MPTCFLVVFMFQEPDQLSKVVVYKIQWRSYPDDLVSPYANSFLYIDCENNQF